MRKILSIIILMLFLIASFSTNYTISAETIDDLQNEISDMESKYDKQMTDIANKQLKYNDLVQQLKDIATQREITENQITETNNEITLKEAEIKDLREVQIPAMEERAQLSLKFAQENMNNNIVLTLLHESASQENSLEVTYAINKILERLNDNLVELGELIKEAEKEEEELEVQKQNLAYQQAELDKQEEYLKEVQGELSYSIAQLEEDASAAENEIAAEKEKVKIYKEAGCGPDDVYGVDCAKNEIPESSSGFVRPLDHAVVTNEYGGWNSILGDGMHSGIDLAANQGTPVHPSAPGKVLYEGWTDDGGGYSIVLLHVMNGENYITRYCHLSETDVNTGDIVNYGDTIGLVGETGAAYGAHLHFEIEKNNTYVWAALENPRNYVNFPVLGGSW